MKYQTLDSKIRIVTLRLLSLPGSWSLTGCSLHCLTIDDVFNSNFDSYSSSWSSSDSESLTARSSHCTLVSAGVINSLLQQPHTSVPGFRLTFFSPWLSVAVRLPSLTLSMLFFLRLSVSLFSSFRYFYFFPCDMLAILVGDKKHSES